MFLFKGALKKVYQMRIKNWNKFQHFKDRKPPWVKLYRDLLDDIDWHELDAQASKVLVMLWLIASEEDGNIPSTKTLAFRLRMTEKQTIDCLNKLSHWLEQDDINAISSRYQSDSLETETETKKETYKNFICPPDGEPKAKKLPECDHKAVIELYHQNLPTMRRVEVWNETRAGYLRQRWREVAAELAQAQDITASDVLNWWGEFFQSVGKSRFLTGRVNSKDGRAFVADLEWILKPSNFAKIVEGKYHGNN